MDKNEVVVEWKYVTESEGVCESMKRQGKTRQTEGGETI